MKSYILFVLMQLTTYSGGIPISQIQAGQELDKAREKTFKYFFNSRMQKCDLLLTTDSFVYFGILVGNKATYFSKVPTDEVLARFPLFMSVGPDTIQDVAKQVVSQKYPKCNDLHIYTPFLRDSAVIVEFRCEVSARVWHSPHRTKILRDSLLLRTTDLSIIK